MIEVDGRAILHHGDCLEVLKTLPDCSVDSIVTDPPAGIAFMGKSWDKDKGGRDAWIAWMQSIAKECLRVIKHGGHALVWAMPRTSHWTGMAWENAGWEPRDKVVHIFGSGFPKSLNVSKAIDKVAGAEREVIGRKVGDQPANPSTYNKQGWSKERNEQNGRVDTLITAPATAEAKQWEGWGTALKPASEDWWLMRKPLDGTVAGNVLAHGTGALNIDACRVGYEAGEVNFDRKQRQQNSEGAVEGAFGAASLIGTEISTYKEAGRWPANVILDGSDEVVAGFPSEVKGGTWNKTQGARYFNNNGEETNYVSSGSDSTVGSAARFFYCAKASVKDREEGLGDLPYGTLAYSNGAQAADNDGADEYTGGSTDIGLNNIKKRKNTHPTVKHTELMRYLCRLITPPNGVVLDAFMGSGSTGKAAMLEGFNFIGIEMEAEYLNIAKVRIEHASRKLGNAPTATEPTDAEKPKATAETGAAGQIGLFE
jgi:site-specific DNA-methyltransferase (adenine-specific)